jgi:hypothetical protein
VGAEQIAQTEVQALANELGVDFDVVPFDEFARGLAVELRHTTDRRLAARAAAARLRELPDYYTRLAIATADEGRLALIGKAQWIRVLDVVLIGPLMLWGAYALSQQKRAISATALGTFGVLTIAFNAWNLAKVADVLRLARQPSAPQAGGADHGGPGTQG